MYACVHECTQSTPCWCTGGNDQGNSTVNRTVFYITYLNNSQQVHVISKRPEYALGGVSFSPNAAFSPNTQQRWTGLIFSNAIHTSIGLPHLTGEKWQLVSGDVMVSQKCASCNYGGTSLAQIYNATATWTSPPRGVTAGSNWTFVASGSSPFEEDDQV